MQYNSRVETIWKFSSRLLQLAFVKALKINLLQVETMWNKVRKSTSFTLKKPIVKLSEVKKSAREFSNGLDLNDEICN